MRSRRRGRPEPKGGRGGMPGLLRIGTGLVSACCILSAALASGSPKEPNLVLQARNVGAVKAQSGGLLLSGQAGGSVDGALVWSLSSRDADGRVQVSFAVEVDGAALVGAAGEHRTFIGLSAYVVDGEGRIAAHTTQGLVVDQPDYRARVRQSGLKFVGRFDLDPGTYTLRVMVENLRSSEYFMSWSTLAVPDSGEAGPQLLPPLFPDPDAPWVLVRLDGGDIAFPLGDGIEILPAARPVLVEGEPSEIYLGGSWGESALVEIRVVNDAGRTVSEPEVSFSGPAVGDFLYRKVVLPPLDLPPGDYSLIVTLADESSAEILRRATRLIVVQEGDRERRLQTVASDAAGVEQEAGAGQQQANGRISKKEIRTAYRDALIALSRENGVTARRMVADLERRALAGSPRKAPADLREAELAEAMLVAAENPDALMPIALMHRALYRSYVARREGSLASHSRDMAIVVAEQLGRAQPGGGFAEGLMVNLASDLAQSGSSSAARELLERTLELDPAFLPAMLSLGFSYEQTSEFLEASRVYQDLVDLHPGFEEGRLRLGVNLIRTGREKSGQELLRALLQARAAAWIEAVAAQELVRSLVSQERMAEAEESVRSALEQMPDDQRLWILLSAILEQSGRFSEAVAILQDLPPAIRGVSPRARYAEWPTLGSSTSQTHLAAMAADAVPALQSALAAEGSGR